MAQFAFALAIAFACFGMETFATPARHSRSLSGRKPLSPRDNPAVYSLIAPSVLADFESRPNTASPSVGDYVASGLSGEMDLVAQEYGLRNSESFYWGLDGKPLANLTAFADGEAVRVLSVERFSGVLDSAECSTSSVKLTFTQEAAFQSILSSWTWINDADENYVVLVTESSQCNIADGDNTDRQPWHVTHATFDDTANTVLLDAEPKTWDEAFGTWRLFIDSRGLLPSQPTRRRGLLETRGGNDTSLSLTYDFSGTAFPLPNDGSVTCTTCSTFGELDFVIEVNSGIEDILDGDLGGAVTVIADNVGLSLDMDVDIRQGDASLSTQFIDLKPPIGAGRVVIAGIIEFTPNLIFGIGSSTEVGQDVTISTGVTVGIPDDASASVTFRAESDDHLSSNHTNWSPEYTAHETRFSNNVDVTGSIGPQLRLTYSVGPYGKLAKALSVLDSNLGGEIGLILTAPELILNATVFDEDTASTFSCPAPVDDNGIFLELSVGLDLGAEESLGLIETQFAATQTIFATATPLTSTCIVSTDAIVTTVGITTTASRTGIPLPTTNSSVSGYAPYGSGPCPTHGALVCNGDDLFAICNWGTAIWQPVADGTACENNQIVGTGVYAVPPVYPSDANSASCDVDGELLCNGVSEYGLCNWGTVVWQPVAAGTQCQSGAIVRRGVYASPTLAPFLATMIPKIR